MTSCCIWLSDFLGLNTQGKPVLQLLLLINFTKIYYLFTVMQNKADCVTALKIVPSLRLNSLYKKWGFLVLMTIFFCLSLFDMSWESCFKLVPGCCFWLPCFSLPTLTFCWYGSFKVCDSAKHFLAGLLLHWRWLKRHLQVRKSIWCLSAATAFKVILTMFLK